MINVPTGRPDTTLVLAAALAILALAMPTGARADPVDAPAATHSKSMRSHPHEIMLERERGAAAAFPAALEESMEKARRLNGIGGTRETLGSTLVIHDWRPDEAYGRLDKLFAILLGNVLSHFSDEVSLVSLADYAAGDVELHDAAFYLGSWSDDPLPDDFVGDVLATRKTFVWVYGNVDRLAEQGGHTLEELFGFSVDSHVELGAIPSRTRPYPDFYDAVLYKGRPFMKYFDYDERTGAVAASAGIAKVVLSDDERAVSHVDIGNVVTGDVIPYLVQSGTFWFIADRPLTYLHERDRYLVLADVLHDVLGVAHEERHLAMVRLEDMSALSKPDRIDLLAEFFAERDIPFSMAVIPRFRDPFDKMASMPDGIELDDWIVDPLITALQNARRLGGNIVMHGITHQGGDTANPIDGVSGTDYEFFDVNANAPFADDDIDSHRARLEEGRDILIDAGIPPFAFEVPHYLASPAASRAIGRTFSRTYQRVTYFTSDDPDLTCNDGTCDIEIGQFFPFEIPEDHYGQFVIPENLGNLRYKEPFQPKEALIRNAEYALAVRDGFASFFFHPVLLDERLATDALADLADVVEAITDLGFDWVDPEQLFGPSATE